MSTTYTWETTEESTRYFENPEDAFYGGAPTDGTRRMWRLIADGSPTDITISEDPRSHLMARYQIGTGDPQATYVRTLADAQVFAINAFNRDPESFLDPFTGAAQKMDVARRARAAL